MHRHLYLLILFAILANTVQAENSRLSRDISTDELDPQLAAAGWKLLRKRGTPPTQFTQHGADEMQVQTSGSNALIYRPLNDLSSGKTALLSWQWRVDSVDGRQSPASGSDPDWPVAIYAAFAADAKHTGWWQRFLNRLAFGFAGLPDTGKFITYVWNLDESAESPYPNPYLPKAGAIFVLQSDFTQPVQWHTEERDLRADFEHAFGHSAGELLYIAISADSEDTSSRSIARIRNLRVDQ